MRILNDSDLDQLSALRLLSRNPPRNQAPADASSRDKGLGLEFKDYQAFGPGDDIRHLDWHHYLRNRKLVVRQYDQLESIHYHLVIDLSGSMACLGTEKIESTRRLCAALAYVILKHLFQLTIRSLGPENQVRSFSGAGQWQSCLEYLESLPAGGDTELGSALQPLEAANRASDHLVIVSDFICAGGMEALKTTLEGIRPACCLIRPVAESEINPAWPHGARLVDSELQTELSVEMSAPVLRSYQQRYRLYYQQLERHATWHGYTYHVLPCEYSLLRQIEALAPQGTILF